MTSAPMILHPTCDLHMHTFYSDGRPSPEELVQHAAAIGLRTIAIDSSGAVYLTGTTLSTTFPVSHATQSSNLGGYTAFVAKLMPAGNALVYATYLGGPAEEWGSSIAVDSAGNAYVTGSTASATFPVTASRYDGSCGSYATGGSDAYVTKFVWNAGTSALSYGFSTFLGGSNGTSGVAIAVNSSGVYVGGYTTSSNYPIFPSAANVPQPANAGNSADGFVTKLNASGTALVYSTYLGGTNAEFLEALALDSAGNVYVTGDTFSSNFPTRTPKQATNQGGVDAFVTKYSWNGTTLSYVYSTYLGSSDDDLGRAIAVNAAGSAYVTGGTYSSTFPTAITDMRMRSATRSTGLIRLERVSPSMSRPMVYRFLSPAVCQDARSKVGLIRRICASISRGSMD